MKAESKTGASSVQDETKTKALETDNTNQEEEEQFLNRLALQNKIIHELITPNRKNVQSDETKPKTKHPFKNLRKSK